MALSKLFKTFVRLLPKTVNKLSASLNPASRINRMQTASLSVSSPACQQPKTQKEFIPEAVVKDNDFSKEIIKRVNEEIKHYRVGRLFAIVQLLGKQYKVTDGDLLILEGHWPPNVGDKLKLEKVLLVGGDDFTLIGAPVLTRNVVSVIATVIEKKLSNTKTRFRYVPRKQFKRTRFIRKEQTMLRINKVKIVGYVDNDEDIIGVSRAHRSIL